MERRKFIEEEKEKREEGRNRYLTRSSGCRISLPSFLLPLLHDVVTLVKTQLLSHSFFTDQKSWRRGVHAIRPTSKSVFAW